jgi:hypothetical protein
MRITCAVIFAFRFDRIGQAGCNILPSPRGVSALLFDQVVQQTAEAITKGSLWESK